MTCLNLTRVGSMIDMTSIHFLDGLQYWEMNVCVDIVKHVNETQREAQQANELSNLTRQRQLLASVNYRHAIIKELERLPGNLLAYKTREDLKRIQKAVLIKVIELKKELRLQDPP
ncbi:hypothetical protein Tco_1227073 [Tanacetum coccineum]